MKKVLGIIASAAFTTALLAACTGGAWQDESPRSDPPETYAAETHATQRARLAALESRGVLGAAAAAGTVERRGLCALR